LQLGHTGLSIYISTTDNGIKVGLQPTVILLESYCWLKSCRWAPVMLQIWYLALILRILLHLKVSVGKMLRHVYGP